MHARRGSIFLIGMMGVGKTTVGRLLAQATGLAFIDCDRELQARAGASIATIFEVEGEEGFRRREAALLEELTQRRGIVLATGGGAVLRGDNRRALRERGLVVYLHSTVDEILRRTRRDGTRPLLQTENPRARIEQLLHEREPLYRQAAHLSFQSGSTNPNKLVQRILAHPEVSALLGEP